MDELRSVDNFHALVMKNGCSKAQATGMVKALVAHACVARNRADAAPDSVFRLFTVYTGRMTRADPRVRIFNDADRAYSDERAAACEALHDLIMEGV